MDSSVTHKNILMFKNLLTRLRVELSAEPFPNMSHTLGLISSKARKGRGNLALLGSKQDSLDVFQTTGEFNFSV